MIFGGRRGRIKLDKDNFKAYILYGINQKVTFDDCIKNGILILLLSALLIAIGIKKSIAFLFWGIVPILVYLLLVVKLRPKDKNSGRKEEGLFYILHNGVFLVCLSYIFGLASIKALFYLVDENDRATMAVILIVGYIVVIVLYNYMIRKLIERNVYGDGEKKLKGGLFFSLFGILGIIIGRILINSMEQGKVGELVCTLLVFLSYICLIGIFNISKYKYIMGHKELLEDSNVNRSPCELGES